MKIGDFVEEYGDGIHGTPKYSSKGKYAFINGNNLDNGQIVISDDTLRIDEDEYNKIKRPLSDKTILISINGTLGKIAFYNGEKVALGKSACYINLKDINYKSFMRYVMSTDAFQRYIYRVATGSTIKNLAPSQIIDYEFNMPAYALKIGEILSNIDRKIALNNSICADLEAMAKQIYDYWFVQFDFPDKNGNPYKSSGGKMVWNEKLNREIPEGWEVKTVNDIIKQLSGYPFSSDDYVENGKYKLYTIKNVQDGYIENDVDNYLDIIPSRMDKGCLLSVGDMIMSLTGNVGRVGIVFEENALLNQRVLKLIPIVVSKMYVRQFMHSDEIQYRISQIASGTSQKNLSPIEFGELNVLYPSDSIMSLYKDKCDDMFDIIISKLQENRQLTELRDFLLPLLMNGQVSVK